MRNYSNKVITRKGADMVGIIYYSKNGNTKILAELLEEKYQGRIVELKETCKRRGFIGFMKSGYQATRRKQSKLIGTPWAKIGEFDMLYLCSPIWAGKITPAVNTFLANADLNGKEVVLFTIMADPNLKDVEKEHGYVKQLIEEKGGKVVKCIGLNGAGPSEQAEKMHIKRQFDTCL